MALLDDVPGLVGQVPLLAVVLAQLMETSLRQSLMLSEGSLMIFVERPIAAIILFFVLASLVLPALSALMRLRGRSHGANHISIAAK